MKNYKLLLERKKGQRDLLQGEIKGIKERRILLKKEIKSSEKVLVIFQQVAKQTQEELQYHISDIVSMALDSIFDEPYTFKVNFITKRNKTECELKFERRDGKEIDPMSSSGGGVIDIASFALRIALWTLKRPRSRNTIILDEPFKFLSKNLLPRAGEMLKGLSNKLGLQFIMVTHLDELTDYADNIIRVKIKNGVSKITTN